VLKELSTSFLDVSTHITTYNANSGKYMNFIQEYVSIALSRVPTLLFITASVGFLHCVRRL